MDFWAIVFWKNNKGDKIAMVSFDDQDYILHSQINLSIREIRSTITIPQAVLFIFRMCCITLYCLAIKKQMCS